jgi:hypothetical protein
MKIRWKINLAISGAFLLGLGFAGLGAYTILSRNALEDSLQNARIMIEGASAIRSLRRSRLFGQLPGKNKLKAGSRLLVS